MKAVDSIIRALERWVPPALRANVYARRRALLAVGVAVAMAALCVLTFPPLVVVLGYPDGLIAGFNTLLVGLLCGVPLAALRRRGWLRFAGNWLAGLVFAGGAFAVLNGGGVRSPFLLVLLVCPLLALVISGRLAGYAWTAICGALIVGVRLATSAGVRFPDRVPTHAYDDALALMAICMLVLMLVIMAFSETSTELAISRVEQTSAELSQALVVEERLRVEARQAHAKNEAMTAFLGRMSHELRTPLNVIIGYSELLVSDVEGDALELERLQDDLQAIHGAGHQLLEVVSNVLELSKLDASRVNMVIKSCPIRPVVEEIIELFRPLATRRGNTIALELEAAAAPGGELSAHADSAKVRQIVMNLVSNAVKFTKGGRVTVRASARGGDAVAIEVEDTGVGIPPDKLDLVFLPFNQADTSATRRHDGAGLGLTIARQLCEVMGGSLTAESKPGAGSRFTVTLPRGP